MDLAYIPMALRLSLCRRRLVQPMGSIIAALNHGGGGLLYQDDRGSPSLLQQGRYIQHRSGFTIQVQ